MGSAIRYDKVTTKPSEIKEWCTYRKCTATPRGRKCSFIDVLLSVGTWRQTTSSYITCKSESLFISVTTFSQRHIVHDLATLHTICIFLCISRDLQNVKKLDHRLISELGKNGICRGDGNFPRVLFDGDMGDFAIIDNEHVSLDEGISN